ncbi:YwhD family protein, partial [Paenibacillus xylanexedens]|uniref:YwhD family protein n=1 Tax=Paenibacillus xylanexedens TaxID=528191 RepID=UPI0021B43A26
MGKGGEVWVVWVGVDGREEGEVYGGGRGCEMWIDREGRGGWKVVAEHVNPMDYALKRCLMVYVVVVEVA